MMLGAVASKPDPYILRAPGSAVDLQLGTAARSLRLDAIDTAVKTLILISAGQSLRANCCGTQYTPTNASKIDNFNVNDGAAYDCSGPLLGCTNGSTGPGNIMPRVADLLITNNRFARVIIAPLAIGGSAISEWQDGGAYADRVPVAMRRLAARGITPDVTGVTFCIEWGQGETDGLNGTSQAAYTASFNSFLAKAIAGGFSGRVFVAHESYYVGTTYSAITNAQAAVVDSVTVFAGGNLDTIPSGSRAADNLHLNDTGAASAATLIYNAMWDSGDPFR